MKPFYATVLAALLLTVTPVLAEESKIDMKKLSCKQFSGYDKDNMSIIMMWLVGYSTDENEGAVIDFSNMAGDTAHLRHHHRRGRGAGQLKSAGSAGLGFPTPRHDMRA